MVMPMQRVRARAFMVRERAAFLCRTALVRLAVAFELYSASEC